jgi:hypothetical protein
MQNYPKKSLTFLCLGLISFCSNQLVLACTIREEAMPQVSEFRRLLNLLEYSWFGVLVAIVVLFFLNLIINRRWKLSLLFPFLGLIIFFGFTVYLVIFLNAGLCNMEPEYRAIIITLSLTASVFLWQLILFVKWFKQRELRRI